MISELNKNNFQKLIEDLAKLHNEIFVLLTPEMEKKLTERDKNNLKMKLNHAKYFIDNLNVDNYFSSNGECVKKYEVLIDGYAMGIVALIERFKYWKKELSN